MPLFVVNKDIFLNILSQSVNEKFKSVPLFDKKIRRKKVYCNSSGNSIKRMSHVCFILQVMSECRTILFIR